MKRRLYLLAFAVLLAVCPLMLFSCGAPTEITHSKDIAPGFSAISIDVKDCNVTILPATDGKPRLEGALRRGRTLHTEVANGTLTVSVKDERAWWQRLFSRTSALTVYLPEREYGALSLMGGTGDVTIGTGLSFSDVTVAVSTGDVSLTDITLTGKLCIEQSTGDCVLSGVSAEAVEILASTGDARLSDITAVGAITLERSTGKTVAERVSALTLSAVADTGRMEFTDVTTVGAFGVTTSTGKSTHTNIKAGSVDIEASTGDVTLSGVRTAGALAVETSTGNIRLTDVLAGAMMKLFADTGNIDLDRADAAELDIETDTGHVMGTLLTEKIFIARSDTGSINVPETTTGGKCKVVTDTGRIELRLAG